MHIEKRSELVIKWLMSGLLRDVKEHQLQIVAERLESSNRISREALDRELLTLSREGYFGQVMNSKQRW